MRGTEKISNAYFNTKSFECKGGLYERLGVKRFGKLYHITIAKLLRNPVWIKGHSAESLARFVRETRIIEAIHMTIGLLLLFAIAVQLVHGYYYSAALIIVINIVTNAYPIMLQRYNRGRIQSLFGEL